MAGKQHVGRPWQERGSAPLLPTSGGAWRRSGPVHGPCGDDLRHAGGLAQAVQATHDYLRRTGRQLPIVVETRTLAEVQQALDAGGIDRIMLDNMGPEQLREAVALVAGRLPLEASGGITEATIGEVAATGVDYISVGALTHSAGSLDLSLKAY